MARGWLRHPILGYPLLRHARVMQRTRRQISLMGRVQAAMNRLDENRTRTTAAKRATKRRPYADGEPLARWESPRAWSMTTSRRRDRA